MRESSGPPRNAVDPHLSKSEPENQDDTPARPPQPKPPAESEVGNDPPGGGEIEWTRLTGGKPPHAPEPPSRD